MLVPFPSSAVSVDPRRQVRLDYYVVCYRRGRMACSYVTSRDSTRWGSELRCTSWISSIGLIVKYFTGVDYSCQVLSLLINVMCNVPWITSHVLQALWYVQWSCVEFSEEMNTYMIFFQYEYIVQELWTLQRKVCFIIQIQRCRDVNGRFMLYARITNRWLVTYYGPDSTLQTRVSCHFMCMSW